MRLNLTAQINLVNAALPRMSVGGRIVFVTSHLALFYGTVSSSPLAFHADAPIYIQLPRLGFQQRP
jgi:NAD(P)-dependent dehydrogenase (short-subunit alcohol dehydrogenase family)